MKIPLFLILALSSLAAEPVIDQFDAGDHVTDRADTALLDIEPHKLTVTAREVEPGVFGRFGGVAVFDWRPEGASESDGFSIRKEDGQYILKVTGMEKITPPGHVESPGIRVHIYFYLPGQAAPLPESAYIPDDVPNSDTSWTFDVRDFAGWQFGGEDKVPDDLLWRPEFYVATKGQDGVGYSFESIGAVDLATSVR